MIKVDVYSVDGKKQDKKITLPAEIFEGKINEVLISQAVRVYLSNQRRARAKVKTRSEVRGTRAKVWRQKGTGRARHGDRFAPIFVGGGRAHGPKGNENYKLRLSKKLRKQALFSSLAKSAKEERIVVVEGLSSIEPKTQKMAFLLKRVGVDKKAVIILPEVIENVIIAGNNIKNLEFFQANQLNAYEILNAGKLIFMKESLELIKKHYLTKNAS
ncbi:MAG: 50S ribosomal protein L4 [Patescibacteria group bacterium]